MVGSFCNTVPGAEIWIYRAFRRQVSLISITCWDTMTNVHCQFMIYVRLSTKSMSHVRAKQNLHPHCHLVSSLSFNIPKAAAVLFALSSFWK